jgi:hypothetical protein
MELFAFAQIRIRVSLSLFCIVGNWLGLVSTNSSERNRDTHRKKDLQRPERQRFDMWVVVQWSRLATAQVELKQVAAAGAAVYRAQHSLGATRRHLGV